MRLLRNIPTWLSGSIAMPRNRRLALSIATGVLTKGAAFGITLLMVPMTLGYLGVAQYGIWMTMVSALAWLSLVDLGIANGLTPALSSTFGRNRSDLAREYVSTAVWVLTGVAITACLLIAVLWDFIDWGYLFNVEDAALTRSVSTSMGLAIGFFLLSLPLAVPQRILLAYQQGDVANACNLAVNLSGLLGVYVVTLTGGGLVGLVMGYSGVRALMGLVIAVWLFTKHMPQLSPWMLPRLKEARHVLSLGGLIFVCQIATLIVFQKDAIIITHYLGPTEAAHYSVSWQLFFFVNVASILIGPYLSPAFGEAFASGDVSWMRRAFGRYLLLTCLVAVPAVSLLAIFHRQLLDFWVGPAVVPASGVIFWLSAWILILAVLNPAVAVLIGVGRLRKYAIASTVAALVSLAFSVFLVTRIGVSGVIASSVLAYALLLLTPVYLEVLRVFGERGEKAAATTQHKVNSSQ